MNCFAVNTELQCSAKSYRYCMRMKFKRIERRVERRDKVYLEKLKIAKLKRK